MVGPPIGFYNSDTYHMATMIVTHDYVLHTNDMDFLCSNWAKYEKAMAFITTKVDETGLLNVTGTANWDDQLSNQVMTPEQTCCCIGFSPLVPSWPLGLVKPTTL